MLEDRRGRTKINRSRRTLRIVRYKLVRKSDTFSSDNLGPTGVRVASPPLEFYDCARRGAVAVRAPIVIGHADDFDFDTFEKRFAINRLVTGNSFSRSNSLIIEITRVHSFTEIFSIFETTGLRLMYACINFVSNPRQTRFFTKEHNYYFTR